MRKKYIEVANAHIDWLNKRAKRAAELEKRVQALQEEKQLVEEECERYKKMFSEERGKNIELEFTVKHLKNQIRTGIT